MGISDRRRHQVFRLAAGIAEHDALIPGTLILVSVAGIDALRDVCGLGMHAHLHFGVFPMKAFLFIANITDTVAGNLFHFLGGHQPLRPYFTGQNNQIGRG